MYLRYIYTTLESVHEVTMRHHTWGNKMENVRARLGYSAYHMRRWLRLLQRSRSSLSYPWPKSMLHSGGIDHNICTLHIEFEKLKYFSQASSLEYIRWIGWLLSSLKLRKFLLLYSKAWKYICYLWTIALYFSKVILM